MIHVLEQVLSPSVCQEILTLLATLSEAEWQDGKRSAGNTAQMLKHNQQLSRDNPQYPALADTCITALKSEPLLISAGLPKVFLPPLFSRYRQGQTYGNHIDNALMPNAITGDLLRTDISLTLFLSSPDSYEGGDLVIEDSYGEHRIKLNAGDAVIYPSSSVHRVEPVTSGERLVIVTWLQSLVAEAYKRQILHDLDISHIFLQQKIAQYPQLAGVFDEELQRLSQSYHNLLRLWVQP